MIVIADNCIIVDASISQFTAAEYQMYLQGSLQPDEYSFDGDRVAKFLPSVQSSGLPEYPLATIISIVLQEPSAESIYAGRSYMLYSFRTRFTSGDWELRSLLPLKRAYQTGDLDWRRTAAAGLEIFCQNVDSEVIEFAQLLCGDPDEMVRNLAGKHLQGFRR